ncbi:hypothetical protein BGZ46_007568 [Entomortierella lignicola]|nr:hypothetical protein BGZ46_007568 [Entomortierella lignicola]
MAQNRSSKPTIEGELAIANSYLQNARKGKDKKQALKLARDAKLKIKSAEKIFKASRKGQPSQDKGIANAYHEHGNLLISLELSNKAKKSRTRAKNWGHIYYVGKNSIYSLPVTVGTSSAVLLAVPDVFAATFKKVSGLNDIPPRTNIVLESPLSNPPSHVYSGSAPSNHNPVKHSLNDSHVPPNNDIALGLTQLQPCSNDLSSTKSTPPNPNAVISVLNDVPSSNNIISASNNNVSSSNNFASESTSPNLNVTRGLNDVSYNNNIASKSTQGLKGAASYSNDVPSSSKMTMESTPSNPNAVISVLNDIPSSNNIVSASTNNVSSSSNFASKSTSPNPSVIPYNNNTASKSTQELKGASSYSNDMPFSSKMTMESTPSKPNVVKSRLNNVPFNNNVASSSTQPQAAPRSSDIRFDNTIATASSPFDTIAISTSIERIPHGIFNQNVDPPSGKYDLPEVGRSTTSTTQLVYCLQLIRHSSTSERKLSSNDSSWIQTKSNDQEEQERLQEITTDLIRQFAQDGLKKKAEIDEVVWLAPVLNQEDYRMLLKLLVDGIDKSKLLESNMVEGLVRLLRNSGPREFDTDDLVQILDLLSSKLKTTHRQSIQHIYKLTLAVSAVLDNMVDNNVTGLSREQLHQPLFKYLDSLMDRPEPYLMYQAAYTFQALQYVPDDESRSQAIQRNGMNLLQGVIGVATGVNGMNIGGAINGLKQIRETVSEITYPFVFNLQSAIASGEKINIREFFRCKRAWYPALRAIDINLRGGKLSEVKQLVNQVPCHRDPAFQLGLCQRLGELAINPLWDIKSRQNAIDFLNAIYKNDAEWGQHDVVKKWILHILHGLQDSPDKNVSRKASTSLQDLKTSDDTKNHYTYCEFEKGSLGSCLLMVVLPPKTSQLFHRIQSKFSLLVALDKLRSRRLNDRSREVYIPPQAKRSLNENKGFDLKTDLQDFLKSNKKVFLLLGDSGSGKSTFNKAFEIDLWEKFNMNDKKIPLFINLPFIEDPRKDLVTKQLHKLQFTGEHIKELSQGYEFILICDGYDETQLKSNIYISNELNQLGWRAQMVISCRTEYNGVDYRDRFEPIDRNISGTSDLFQEAVIAPFNKYQIQDYIEKYLSVNKSTETRWDSKDYEQVLEEIPTLHDLVKNPFLLRLALEALPLLVNLNKGFSSQRVTRIALYDKFVYRWLERNRKRFSETIATTNAEAFDRLCETGFIKHGLEFIRDIAAAIYIKNDGKPVVTYPVGGEQSTWKDAFFSQTEENKILQQAIPIIRNGSQYRFINKSILDYGLTLAIFDPNEQVQTEESISNSPIQGPDMSTTNNTVATTVVQSLIESPLGKKIFVREPSILQFLAERVQQQSVFKDRLLAVINKSKTNNDASIAAANAITVLIRAGVQFIGADLRGIKIPGADLSFGVFDSAQLQRADLQKANLRNIWLRQANLDNAQMDGVQFGELTLLQEKSWVDCCAYSPDGSIFAAGLKNGTISLYKTSNWKKIRTLTGHNNAVTSLSFSKTNSRMASQSDGKTMRLWNVDTGGHVLITMNHGEGANSVVLSPKGDQLASGSHDKAVRLWGADRGECAHILKGHSGAVISVVYSPRGDRIASGSGDNTVKLWNAETGTFIRTLKGHSSVVRSVAYSPKGDRIASGSDDKTVRLWDVDTGNCMRTWSGSGNIAGIIYSPKGDQIASRNDDKIVQLWDIDKDECLHTLKSHKGHVYSLLYSPNGNRIAFGSNDKTVRVWNAYTGECVHILQGHSNTVRCVAYSPKGDRIASGSNDKAVRLWDVITDESVHISQGHSDSVTSVVYLSKGSRIASGSWDKTVRLWDTDTGICVNTLQGHTDSVESVVYSPKRNQIASGGDDKTVRLWDADTGKYVRSLEGHNEGITSIAYSQDEDRIASGSDDKTVRLWEAATGLCLHTLKGHSSGITSVAYSPNGDHIASGSRDKTVRLWNVVKGECFRTLKGHSDSVESVAYSPNGDQIASGSDDKTVKLWDAGKGICVSTLKGHTSYVRSIVYSPRGDRIASGSGDNTAKLWDVKTEQCLITISDFNGPVYSLSMKSDSDSDSLFLVTGSHDKSVRHWRITKVGDQYEFTLCWSSSHEALTLTNTSLKDVRGLRQLDRDLLIQRGALIPTALP